MDDQVSGVGGTPLNNPPSTPSTSSQTSNVSRGVSAYSSMAADSTLASQLLGSNATPQEVAALMSNLMSWFSTIIQYNLQQSRKASQETEKLLTGQE